MRLVVLGCVLASGCLLGHSDPSGPPEVMAPSTFNAVSLNVPAHQQVTGQFSIDLGDCTYEELFAWLPLGSAWVLVHPAGQHCELWLGGETENPNYDGSPSQYCLFNRQGAIAIPLGDGGPARLDYPWCVGL